MFFSLLVALSECKEYCGTVCKDRVRNQFIRGGIEKALITDEILENRLRWSESISRRDEAGTAHVFENTYVDGKKKEKDHKRGGMSKELILLPSKKRAN